MSDETPEPSLSGDQPDPLSDEDRRALLRPWESVPLAPPPVPPPPDPLDRAAVSELLLALLGLPVHPADQRQPHALFGVAVDEIAFYPDAVLAVVAEQLRRQYASGELRYRPRPPQLLARFRAAVPAAVDFAAELQAVFAGDEP